MKRLIVGTVLFALPLFAGAAGFAKQTIFLSTESPIEGQTILIHASVANSAATKFTGKLDVREETGAIGTVDVSLNAGAADNVSVSWKPKAGSHTVTATLKDSTGTAVEESSQKFIILSKTPPASTESITTTKAPDAVELSDEIQASIGTISPVAEEYSAPVFQVIDSGRVFAANELSKAIDWSKQQVGKPKQPAIFATSTEPEKTGVGATAWKMLSTVILSILSVLLYIVTNAGIFYPILAVVFFYILWRCWKRYRR